MLREQDGRPHSLRQLMMDQVIPALERSPISNLVCLPNGNAGALDTDRINANLERHQFPELCFCLRGRAEMWVDSQLANCDEHQVVIIPSGVPHSVASLHCILSVPEDVFSRLLWISVFPFGSVINLCESAYGLHRSTPRQLFLSHRSLMCVDQVIAEVRGPREGSELVIKYALLQLMVSIWRGQPAQSDEIIEQQAAFHEPAAGRALGLSEKILQHIRCYYYTPDLSLETMAGVVGASRSHISRQFKLETGLTITECIHNVRIDVARRLLLAGVKVSMVADYVGFTDPYYFSRVFTKVVGCSPSEYRNRGTE